MDDQSFNIRVPRKWARIAAIVGVTALIVAPLTAIASHSFTDVPDSNTFHSDIAWLADAGVTKGCNPPANTQFCPDDSVTRGQMSAFMRRFAQYIDAEDGTPANADHATNADTADDADKVDGMNASALDGVLQPGETLSGAWAVSPNNAGFGHFSMTFYPQLPGVIPNSNMHYLASGTSADCPGHGEAAPGHLCVYQASASGATFGSFASAVSPGTNSAVFGVNAFMNGSASAGNYARGSWAVTGWSGTLSTDSGTDTPPEENATP